MATRRTSKRRAKALLSGLISDSVAYGEHHLAIFNARGGSWLSNGGHLCHGDRVWVMQTRLEEALDPSGYHVAAVSCGEAHTLVITEDAELLSCSSGEHGHNGNGASCSVLSFEPIDVIDRLR